MPNQPTNDLKDRAYAAFDDGKLSEASHLFAELLELEPDSHAGHYMRGLIHKYLRDWPVSLHHNLRAIETADEPDEASQWNAGIAATALGDWSVARQQWKACGIAIPDDEGPVETDFGVVSVRLNPWAAGETLFARRIDVVRARLLNVPLPESGHRFGDIVLHDGASTGQREMEGRTVPVFNALERLTPSDFTTHTAFVRCETPGDMAELLESTLPGIGYVEDWSDSIVHYCLRCSYGTPHRHGVAANEGRWNPDRNLGIAAQSRVSVDRLLYLWTANGPGRRVDSVELREYEVPLPEEGHIWWREPEDEQQDAGD